jgi:thioredoxin-dependent peroxiredoxin
MRRSVFAVAGAALVAAAPAARAQNPPAPAAPALTVLDTGVVAPDFALTGATRFGILKAPVRLSDFRGKTVVLAFFFKARTRG